MFTTNIYEVKTQQEELHRQAAHYRLIKSLDETVSFADRFSSYLGKLMVKSGRMLVHYAQAAR